MDIIFDIDGTLANAEHRLRFIKDPAFWTSRLGRPPAPDWETFLSDEQMVQDRSIIEIWTLLLALKRDGHRIIFVTGRSDLYRDSTIAWLKGAVGPECTYREALSAFFEDPVIYMRKPGDHRPSDLVKIELLDQVRADGYDPKMAVEDRANDTRMWREAGLICCQVAVGDY